MIMKSISSKTRCMVLTTVALIPVSFSVAHATDTPAKAQTQPAAGDTATTTAPDNSANNAKANSETGLTAEQAGNSETDVKLTAKIRQALVKDKKLSTYAHNVKIITENGQVVLKGPVKSQSEKTEVETKAGRIAGVDRVRSELEVAK
ncbi:MAG: BON domain-containing protein [Pseudobdellovibrionaceae bacterium]|uniref:BON domain-containing protein n=1 Tax=Oligoflexus sp. TaxID=1971216 RepID=UPI0027C3891A|nr:BON domain-containing protein [Oligoflexus sp.]MDQ3233675.1 BON domain-containing protein [Pseudobdellovibrionaceae bacterium]HYX31788.1 BON domain-containing protein [Oligoflexus sp.]